MIASKWEYCCEKACLPACCLCKRLLLRFHRLPFELATRRCLCLCLCLCQRLKHLKSASIYLYYTLRCLLGLWLGSVCDNLCRRNASGADSVPAAMCAGERKKGPRQVQFIDFNAWPDTGTLWVQSGLLKLPPSAAVCQIRDLF